METVPEKAVCPLIQIWVGEERSDPSSQMIRNSRRIFSLEGRKYEMAIEPGVGLGGDCGRSGVFLIRGRSNKP